MASQSLYRKWRSQTFGDMVGQEPVIRTLKNALNSGTLAHAYLFAGPRGTGKTSTARLLAKTINCLQPRDGEPCNVCEQCREITAGNSFNVIEIDAASNRGIDSIRELREKVMVPPSTGKYKVYILDEAHMLTTEAFNALLKTLEEPPPHAIFVMATTDVHKMLQTVLSRCQRFDFKRFTVRQIVEHLHFVSEQEQIKLERGAAELIARAAAGGMRDALSLLDQATAYAGQEISLAQVQTMLGVADPQAIQKFVTNIAQLDSAGGLHLIHELAESGADLRQINAQVAEYWRGMMLARAGANIATILDSTDDEVREIVQMSQQFSLDVLTEGVRVFAQNDLVQKSQATPQLGLELAFLSCIEIHRRGHSGQEHASTAKPVSSAPPRPVPPQRQAGTSQGPSASQAANQAAMRVAPPVEAKPAPPVSVETHEPPPAETKPIPPVKVEEIPVAEEAPPVAAASKSLAAESAPVALPDWDDFSYQDHEEDVEVPPASRQPETPAQETVAVESMQSTAEPEEAADDAPTLTIGQVKEKWEYVRKRIKSRKDGSKIAAFLSGYVIVNVEGTSKLPVIIIRAPAELHYKSLQKEEYVDVISWAMKVELGHECRVRLIAPGALSDAKSGVTIPPPANGANNLSNTMMAVSSLPSAFRERPAPAPDERPPAVSRGANAWSSASYTKQQSPPGPPSPTPEVKRTEPLARNAVVRENIDSIVSARSETHQQSIEKEAKNDPVVKEVLRLFKAEIKDIQPK